MVILPFHCLVAKLLKSNFGSHSTNFAVYQLRLHRDLARGEAMMSTLLALQETGLLRVGLDEEVSHLATLYEQQPALMRLHNSSIKWDGT